MTMHVEKLPSNGIPLASILAAQENIRPYILRTPLIPFHHHELSGARIYLKPECLQPIGSFKIRGAANALTTVDDHLIENGIYTASAGNMAQGLGYLARAFNLPCVVYVPDHAPQTKLDAIKRMGAEYIKLPFDKWWQIIKSHHCEGAPGHFIHPVSNPNVIAGNGTIGLEILEDLPEVDTIVVPYGGGGLSAGIASAVKFQRSDVKVFASEVATASPLAHSFRADKPMQVSYQKSFVDGIGSAGLLPEMWPLVRNLLDDSIVVTLSQVAASIKSMIIQNRMIAEGAGASSLSAALTGRAGNGIIVCIISGGNIDFHKLAIIMSGQIPA